MVYPGNYFLKNEEKTKFTRRRLQFHAQFLRFGLFINLLKFVKSWSWFLRNEKKTYTNMMGYLN